MPSPLAQYTLPLTLQHWPWPRRINPHYQLCKDESSVWIRSFEAFSIKSQKAFDRCDFSLLASLAYPLLNKDGNRVGCDLMNFFFVVDEYTDIASSEEARRLCDIIKDALNNPHDPRPAGEWVGGEVARQFWENAIKTGTPSFQRRFVKTFGDYLDAVVDQAIDRNDARIRDVESYLEIRRKTIGALPSFAVLEVHMNLTDGVFADPIISRLVSLTVEMIILCNDFCSYNVEQARGDDSHNIIRVLMDVHKTDIQGALGHVSDLHDKLSQEFLDLVGRVPSFGDPRVDSEVSTYVDGLANWVRANDCWSFESHRYFGNQGVNIQQTRVVELLPKIKQSAITQTPETQHKTMFEFLVRGVQGITELLYNVVFGSRRQSAVSLPPAATEIVV